MRCGAGTVGGATLVKVSTPENWKYLAKGFGEHGLTGPDIAHGVHSAFACQDGRKAYAVLVDDYEATDVDIFNITNPRQPRQIAEYDLAALFPQTLQPGLEEVFLHDMVVKTIGGRPSLFVLVPAVVTNAALQALGHFLHLPPKQPAATEPKAWPHPALR